MKINRFTCGNGEGMFENKKGYWVSYEDHLKALKELKENLTIPVVSQQRELLLAYHRYLVEELSLDLHEVWVNEHLKANNCG